MASRPVLAVSTVIPRRSRTGTQGEDVADVVVHHKHGLALQVIVRAVQSLQHLLLGGGQVGNDTVQE